MIDLHYNCNNCNFFHTLEGDSYTLKDIKYQAKAYRDSKNCKNIYYFKFTIVSNTGDSYTIDINPSTHIVQTERWGGEDTYDNELKCFAIMSKENPLVIFEEYKNYFHCKNDTCIELYKWLEHKTEPYKQKIQKFIQVQKKKNKIEKDFKND